MDYYVHTIGTFRAQSKVSHADQWSLRQIEARLQLGKSRLHSGVLYDFRNSSQVDLRRRVRGLSWCIELRPVTVALSEPHAKCVMMFDQGSQCFLQQGRVHRVRDFQQASLIEMLGMAEV